MFAPRAHLPTQQPSDGCTPQFSRAPSLPALSCTPPPWPHPRSWEWFHRKEGPTVQTHTSGSEQPPSVSGPGIWPNVSWRQITPCWEPPGLGVITVYCWRRNWIWEFWKERLPHLWYIGPQGEGWEWQVCKRGRCPDHLSAHYQWSCVWDQMDWILNVMSSARCSANRSSEEDESCGPQGAWILNQLWTSCVHPTVVRVPVRGNGSSRPLWF